MSEKNKVETSSTKAAFTTNEKSHSEVQLPRSLQALLSSHSRKREPVTPSKGRVVGKMASRKNSRCVHWESQLEYKAMLLMEFSNSVLSYDEQPETFVISNANPTFRYTPDVRITMSSGVHAYVEVKPLSKVLRPEVKERLTAISDYFLSIGSEFLVLTEVEIEKRQTLETIRFLKPYARLELPEMLIAYVRAKLMELDREVSLQTFVNWFKDKKFAYACIAQNIAAIDLEKALCSATLIRLPQEKDNENCLFHYRLAPTFA